MRESKSGCNSRGWQLRGSVLREASQHQLQGCRPHIAHRCRQAGQAANHPLYIRGHNCRAPARNYQQTSSEDPTGACWVQSRRKVSQAPPGQSWVLAWGDACTRPSTVRHKFGPKGAGNYVGVTCPSGSTGLCRVGRGGALATTHIHGSMWNRACRADSEGRW